LPDVPGSNVDNWTRLSLAGRTRTSFQPKGATMDDRQRIEAMGDEQLHDYLQRALQNPFAHDLVPMILDIAVERWGPIPAQPTRSPCERRRRRSAPRCRRPGRR
jgi:hypothetical protein